MGEWAVAGIFPKLRAFFLAFIRSTSEHRNMDQEKAELGRHALGARSIISQFCNRMFLLATVLAAKP